MRDIVHHQHHCHLHHRREIDSGDSAMSVRSAEPADTLLHILCL